MNLRRLIHHLADGYDQAPTVLPPHPPPNQAQKVLKAKDFKQYFKGLPLSQRLFCLAPLAYLHPDH